MKFLRIFLMALALLTLHQTHGQALILVPVPLVIMAITGSILGGTVAAVTGFLVAFSDKKKNKTFAPLSRLPLSSTHSGSISHLQTPSEDMQGSLRKEEQKRSINDDTVFEDWRERQRQSRRTSLVFPRISPRDRDLTTNLVLQPPP